ncbi:lens fiber membrane intrinsic protein [Microcaecilia unicolor]|uniref:Lens fiber membrane intrinsic protein-like n=1 Tax=Microcaecilia unicolor TaxID=1415580 RepID=A0A6P7YXL4_9AMPH|nr:lens fiber membrane intrinsic protein-like [Microcaecilia unicolor]
MLLVLLKVAILSLISLSTLFMLICIVSTYWVIQIFKDNVTHWGLWMFCDDYACYTATGGGYTKTLLILGLIIGSITIFFAGLELKFGANGTLGCLKLLIYMNFAIAFIELIGMIRGSFIFTSRISFSWSYYIGWVAVAMAIAAGGISVVNHLLEPVEPAAIVNMEQGVISVPSSGRESEILPQAEVPPASELPPSYDELSASQPHPQDMNSVATITPGTVA